MKFLNSLLLLLSTSGLAHAAPPENHRADRYKDLYLNSPITDPPPVDIIEEGPSAVPDWVLVGVTKYINRTQVQIMNVNDRSRMTIPSKEASELGFSIKEVVQDRNYLKNTVVTLQIGKDTGEVRFDPKFLVLKKVAGPSAPKGARPGRSQVNPAGRNGKQPPTPPGVRNSSKKSNGSKNSPPKPGSVPRPSAASSSAKPATTSAKKSKRTRYVLRPKK